VLLPKGFAGRVRQIAKPHPYVASRRTGEVFAPDLLVLRRELRVDAVRVECLRICPLNFSSLWIDLEPSFLADCGPTFPLLVDADLDRLKLGVVDADHASGHAVLLRTGCAAERRLLGS
jgi:hypothetical protein